MSNSLRLQRQQVPTLMEHPTMKGVLRVTCRMVKVMTSGRTDLDEYFRLSGVFESEKLNHTPLLIFITSEYTVTVPIIEKPSDLILYPDDTPVMGQLRGEWHSDFFQFNVRDYRQFFENRMGPLKSAKNMIRVGGPQGGYRHLSYEYVDQNGSTVHSSTHIKSQAESLEAFFAASQIPVLVQKAH